MSTEAAIIMSSTPDPKTSNVVETFHNERTIEDHQQLADLLDDEDRNIGKWAAIRKNPLVFAWCLYGVWTIMLVSFENQAAGIVVGIPQFRKDFGSLYDGLRPRHRLAGSL